MSVDSETPEAKRRRGIQASPTKLRKALVDSGLKTQLALADRIAELEQLDSAPRGLVNRIFRGDAVDPASLERVARALKVPAWTLYRGSDEPADAKSAESESAAPVDFVLPRTAATPLLPRSPKSRLLWLGLAVACIALLAATYVALRPQPATTEPAPIAKRSLSAMVVVTGPRGDVLEPALAKALDREWRIVPRAPGLEARDAQSVLATRDVDRVLEMHTIEVGRWLGMALYLHQRGSMREMWVGAVRQSAGPATLASLLASATRASIGKSVAAADSLNKRAALDRYLSARHSVDAANIELNGRRALTDFASAIRLDPEFADAYAGQCEALVLDNVRTGDAARLAEAEAECARALAIDPDSIEARRAQAYLDRKRGRLDESQAAFSALLRDTPEHVDAMIGLAEVHITRFARGNDPTALQQAIALLEQAATIEPRFWKIPFTLARAHYSGSNLKAAIDANTRAVELDANILALSNLGTYQFCQGDLAGARAAYDEARRRDAAAFVGEGQLGVVAYFQRDFDAAVAYLRHAIDLHEASGKAGDHRLWSNYADALRRRGDRDAARDAYLQAVTLAERDAAGGDGNPVHRSYLAFYYEVLARLDSERWAARRVSDATLRELAASNDPMSLMYVASVYFQRGETRAANTIKARASEGCPGFALSPDLQMR